MLLRIALSGLLLFLNACAYTPAPPVYGESRPAPPVYDQGRPAPRGDVPPPLSEPLPGPTTAPVPVPLPDREYRPAPAPATTAVLALLDTARNQGSTGNLDGAAASLERALRIEPRNARLWSELAAVRLQQQQAQQAEQLAAKSNALAPRDTLLQQSNWRIIAEARRLRGDAGGARAAEQRVRELR